MLATPEIITPSRDIIVIRKHLTEEAAFASQITIRADNADANSWLQMVNETQTNGLELGKSIFYDHLARKFIAGPTVVGTELEIETPDGGISFPSPIKGLRKFLPTTHVANMHTHFLPPDSDRLKTSLPSEKDIRAFLWNAYPAMFIIDRGGVHMFIRTAEQTIEEVPSENVMKEKLKQSVGKYVADIQPYVNQILQPYGARYFYTEQLDPSADGTVTFRAP
jgi:hypothetical protein